MLRVLLLATLVAITWVISVFHMACLPRLSDASLAKDPKAPESFFLAKEDYGLNHLVLFGSAYQRGFASGTLTKKLLHETEDILFSEFHRFFPNPFFRWTFITLAMRWFSGSERYIPRDIIEEAYGISQATHHKYDSVLDPLTLAVAFHGIHEVGQLFVDMEKDDFGCTVFATRFKDSWIVGRNFDFEIGRYFDANKILKWHFPMDAYAYLSVIWPGMIGTVTGVNEHGVYISINAAGSSDFRRLGTPTTLVATEALMHTRSAKEAVAYIEAATVFVTDIYVVTDAQDSYRVEKSPDQTIVEAMKTDTAVTNHLLADVFRNDRINEFRRKDLTSSFRLQRANVLLGTIDEETRSDEEKMQTKVLSFLRDKADIDGAPLHLGNKRAIDALIATHSVIYNARAGTLFVNQGPALVGAFKGYDLKASFAAKRPVATYDLPADSALTAGEFYKVKDSLKMVARAEQALKEGACDEAQKELLEASATFRETSNFYLSYGKYAETCAKLPQEAKHYWSRALSLEPAYASQRKFLQKRVM